MFASGVPFRCACAERTAHRSAIAFRDWKQARFKRRYQIFLPPIELGTPLAGREKLNSPPDLCKSKNAGKYQFLGRGLQPPVDVLVWFAYA
jgi:hypothetical protein